MFYDMICVLFINYDESVLDEIKMMLQKCDLTIIKFEE